MLRAIDGWRFEFCPEWIWCGLVVGALLLPVGCGAEIASPEPGTNASSGASGKTESVFSNDIQSASGQQSGDESKGGMEGGSGNDATSVTDPVGGDWRSVAREFIEDRQYQQAIAALTAKLIRDPETPEASLMLAECYAGLQNFDLAIETSEGIPLREEGQSVSPFGLAALGQSAMWCVNAHRYDDAIAKYLELIDAIPTSGRAHREVAYLLNRQGRRHEAARHIRVLCKMGDIRRDELHSLMVLSDAIYDDPGQLSESKAGERRYEPIGASGVARKLFAEARYVDAASLLEESVVSGQSQGAVRALFGRCLAEAQDDQRFARWVTTNDDESLQYAEYWAAMGAWLVNQQRFDEAVRALSEAILLDPTDVRSYRRLEQCFTALQRTDDAKRWYDRHQLLREVTLASNMIGSSSPPQQASFATVSDGLKRLGRPLEALLWEVMGLQSLSQNDAQMAADGLTLDSRFEELNQRLLKIVRSGDSFPSREERLIGLDYRSYPMFHFDPALVSVKERAPNRKASATTTPHWVDVARDVGVTHSYQVASNPQDSEFSIYQVVGGGVAVIDYDLDGHVDLYFAQGGADPPDFQGQISNQLYRQSESKFIDVSSRSGTIETRYSTGVTAGDWNQDGFPDLIVANLGINSLMINNGDGTFRREPTDELDDLSMVSSSIGMADLDGDHLPDLFEQTYVHDPAFTRRPTRNAGGIVEILSPFLFQPGMDRILFNDGMGGRVATDVSVSGDARGTGLGLVIADFDGQSGNEIYVANDMLPNQLWKRTDEKKLADMAPMSGASLGHDGTRTSSMGVAAGDFDLNGSLDLHITNFENAPVRLYLSQRGVYRDRAITFGLAEPSYEFVGFGTQAIDYDNDGLEDLVVANGHVENTGIETSPFAQFPQTFTNLGDRFRLVDFGGESEYFMTPHVGRALARADINSDGRDDCVVTHLGENSAILINETKSENHFLRVKLVGTHSERDAIGATVSIGTKSHSSQTKWVTSGDGYLCRNEQVVTFGLGKDAEVQTLGVSWPDGTQETFENIAVDRTYLIVQDQGEFEY